MADLPINVLIVALHEAGPMGHEYSEPTVAEPDKPP